MKPQTLLTLAGDPMDPVSITITKAAAFYEAVDLSPFAEVSQVLKLADGTETVVVRAQVQLSSKRVCDIRGEETFAVLFDPKDAFYPRVWMLREDFPELPHQLLEIQEKPRSLCLYNQDYNEVKLFWTGFLFLERIREWLRLSALGELHQSDQPLEPLMMGEDGVIYLESVTANQEVYLYDIGGQYRNRLSLVATGHNRGGQQFPASLECLVGKPQLHGIIKRSPRDLRTLAELLLAAGIDLADFLKQKLTAHKTAGINLNNRLLLMIDLPKIREENGEVVSIDHFVFLTADSLATIGKKLNLWDDLAPELGMGYVMGAISTELLKTVEIGILRPVLPFQPALAHYMNSVEGLLVVTPCFAVGAGALGSQFIMNLVRAGIGKWSVADPDLLFPHNLARHTLLGFDLMTSKVLGLARQANSILKGSVTPLVKDVVNDQTDPAVLQAIASSELLVDLSASTAAYRSLAGLADGRRIASFFLNPSGTDLVAIVQDKQAKYDAMALEVQYLRFLLHTDPLHDHFKKEGEPIRYGAGCRDISSTLPQDSIALAAGIGSKYFKQVLTSDKPSIKVWRTDPDTLSVTAHQAEVQLPIAQTLGDWTVFYDDYLIDKIYERRAGKLPNETGGVLLGTYDMERKIVFVADIIGSPEDSYEYPTAYIRGIKNLGEELRHVAQVTAGGLQYIGEWHSHPEGYGPGMSEDDLILFAWLHENMYQEGLPALMAIAGENRESRFYISKTV
ncbi:hypothetical protein GWC95_15615 [Sediminibacterium roseum]|uniref:Integrative and conjugative element protein, VC0181 family n=1 Tax=Sediminibacterium roseum TaxID=1978412 RepID=A0ABW9ZW49_9BACT|nr:ThiF family adenylyltransferase [Sediminibacterium roseum]NCI51356.1 hypothetical protein [Sediminibacterium roseum]